MRLQSWEYNANMSTGNLYHGIVHGRVIELDTDPQLPDGMKVALELQTPPDVKLEMLRRACGGWKDMPDLDEAIKELYEARLSDTR
jgi:hypothetical protein